MQNGSQRHNDRGRAKTSLKKYTSHFICNVCEWEGVGDRTELQYIDPHSYGRQRCVFLVLQGCSTGGPGAQLSAGWWLSLLHLISNFSGPQLIRGSKGPLRRAFSTTSHQQLLWTPTQSGATSPFGLVWLSLPHLVSNSVRSPTLWLLVLTELYNSSTSTQPRTQSPTQSLEWLVWLSSSGNYCHAVQRSLSSGASVYECIIAFTLSHFISQIRPRDLFWLLAIGMCHFLPVHHFGMACLPGPKVEIQQYSCGPLRMDEHELISDILLWTPSHGRAKAGRPARTYIRQVCADTECSLEHLPEAMDDRGWGEG